MKAVGSGPQWKYFEVRQVKEAKEWADSGGVAVHQSGFTYRQRPTAHLMAADHPSLMQAASLLRLSPAWYQAASGTKASREHFDIFGMPLEMALVRCINKPPLAVASCRLSEDHDLMKRWRQRLQTTLLITALVCLVGLLIDGSQLVVFARPEQDKSVFPEIRRDGDNSVTVRRFEDGPNTCYVVIRDGYNSYNAGISCVKR